MKKKELAVRRRMREDARQNLYWPESSPAGVKGGLSQGRTAPRAWVRGLGGGVPPERRSGSGARLVSEDHAGAEGPTVPLEHGSAFGLLRRWPCNCPAACRALARWRIPRRRSMAREVRGEKLTGASVAVGGSGVFPEHGGGKVLKKREFLEVLGFLFE